MILQFRARLRVTTISTRMMNALRLLVYTRCNRRGDRRRNRRRDRSHVCSHEAAVYAIISAIIGAIDGTTGRAQRADRLLQRLLHINTALRTEANADFD